MHWRNRIGGSAVAALSCLGGYGCDAQVGQQYSGEVMLELRGHVTSADQPTQDVVPALMTYGDRAPAPNDNGGPVPIVHIMEGKLEGIFPSDFKLSIAGPPPQSERYGMALGFVVLVPREHQTIIEPPDTSSWDGPAEDSSVYDEHRTICMRSGECVERDYECVEELCELISVEGEHRDGSESSSRGYTACNNGICYALEAECIDDPSCYRAAWRCDTRRPGSTTGTWEAGKTVKTCTQVGESGDTSVKPLEEQVLLAHDLWVFYVERDKMTPEAESSGFRPGYNLVRMTAATSDERFLEYANCRFEQDVAAKRAGTDEGPTLVLFDPVCRDFEVVEDPATELVDLNLSGAPPR
jgi:hypothetical protein